MASNLFRNAQTGTGAARWASLIVALASCASANPVQLAPSARRGTERVAHPPRGLLLPNRQASTPANRSAASPLPVATLTVFFIDVGQGDATLLVGPGSEQERHVLLIDAGPLANPDGGAAVRQLMQAEGIEHIDYAILTHFDADHLGGFVTTQGSTSLFWSKDCSATPLFPRLGVYEHLTERYATQSAQEWDRCARAVTRRVRVSKSEGLGDVLELGGGYSARIIAGDGYVLDHDQRVANVGSENSRSVVTLVTGPGGFELLIPGDATGQAGGAERARVEVAIGEYLSSHEIDLEVLRVGHHGAENTSNPTFIEAAKPEVAVISVGNQQPANFKHPRCKTYATLAAMHVKYVIQTQKGAPDCAQPAAVPLVAQGSIRLDVTGASYRISSAELRADVQPISLACTPSECSRGTVADALADCCRYCKTGLPCGNTCIARGSVCNQPRGCACAAE